MSIASLIEKRQAGAPERKAKREAKKAKKAEHKAKMKALERSAQIGEQERIRKAREKKQAESAIIRGRKKAQPTDYRKIASKIGRGAYRVAKKATQEEKPKRRRVKAAPKTIPKTRKFSGKVFTIFTQNLTKPQATKKASSLRKSGKLVRTVKIGVKYAVYIR